MHILRFFLTHASAPMRGCAPARRSIRVYTLARRPVSRLSSDTRVSLSNTGHGLDQSFLCLLTRLPHSKLPFKSHSTASAANASGFLLVSLSKTPQIQFLLQPE